MMKSKLLIGIVMVASFAMLSSAYANTYSCPQGEVMTGVITQPCERGSFIYVTKGVLCTSVKQVLAISKAK